VLAAFLFAVHPVHVESVAWISELKNTLSTVCYLGVALLYLQFDQTRRGRHWAGATALFVCALLSKTVTATLPIYLLIVLWWKRGALGWVRDVRPLLPMVVLATAGGAMTVWAEHTLIGAHGAEFQLSMIERTLLAGRAVWFYLTTLVWPVGLVFTYPRWTISQAAWWQYLYPLALSALAVGLWRIRARARAPLAVLLLYVVALGPALGFVNVYPFRYSFVADHFQYAASIVVIASLAVMATRLASQSIGRPAWRMTLAAAALAPLVVLTWQHSHQFVSAEVLYRTTIARNPQAWMAHHNLGEMKVRSAEGDLQEALGHIRESLRINPDNADAHNTLGFTLQRLGRLDEARREYDAALRLVPGLAAAHNNLGVLAYDEARLADAVGHFREASRLDPADPEPTRNLGLALLDLGRLDEAAPHIERAFSRNPASPDVLETMGTLALRRGQPEQAMGYFQSALAARPDSARTHTNIGMAFESLGRLPEAEAEYRVALRIGGDVAAAHDNLGYVLLRQRRFEEAVTHLTEAIRLRPGFVASYGSLGAALQELRRLDDAIAVYPTALSLAPDASAADLHNALGVALAQAGRTAEAIASFREALRLNPGLRQARENLDRALRR
jgi:Flp pilus assembly protein TadD